MGLLWTRRHWAPCERRDRRFKRTAALVLLACLLVICYLSYSDRDNRDEDRYCKMQSISRGGNSTAVSRPSPALFRFLHNHRHACSQKTDLLILVNSAPPNRHWRAAMRDTWLRHAHSPDQDVTVLFFMGSGESPDVTRELTVENAIFSDVIQADFVDTYNNLTLKTIAMMQWVTQYCPHAKQMLKVDDDVYIQFHHLMSLLMRVRHYPRHILGKIGVSEKPNRETDRYKWAISTEEYAEDELPAYAHGPAYVISGDLVGDLFTEAASHRKPLKLEDVFVTGICAREVGATHIGDCGFTFRRRLFFPRMTSISGHGYSPVAMRYVDWVMWLLHWTAPVCDFVLWVLGL